MKEKKKFERLLIGNSLRIFNAIIIAILVFSIGCSSADRTDSPVENIDTQEPSTPTDLRASNTTVSSTNLKWTESTDNVGIQTYLVFKDNDNFAANPSTERSITGLNPSSTYTFKVQAKDKAGNTSGFSNEISVTTLETEAELKYFSGDLENYMGNIIDNVPGDSGSNYQSPSAIQIASWDLVVDAILSENLEVAVEKSAEVNYKITEFTDNTFSPNQIFYILEENNPQSYYWGTYVFSKTPDRASLVITAPHIKNDINTGKQAVYSFKNNLARAVFISGTHRCNHSDKSSCSGSTSTCNSGPEAYRISDMAHNVNTIFQKTTENLFYNVSGSVFIQLHGFGKKPTDPYVIISNGTRETPAIDYAAQIRDALLTEDNSLTFKLAHIDTDWTRLIGFTNTQGRLINNSSNPCTLSASSSTGRFIHIEQEKSKLRNSSSDWVKMSNALGKVF